MKTALSLIVLVITITMGIGISCVSHASGKDTTCTKHMNMLKIEHFHIDKNGHV